MRTSSWGMPSADSAIAQRGAWRAQEAHHERHEREEEDDRGAGEPADAVSGTEAEPGAARRAPRRDDGGQAGHDEQQAAEDEADARDVVQVAGAVDDVEAVGHDAEAGGEQTEDDAQGEPRRTRHARLREQPGGRRGEDGEHAEHGGVGARQGEVQQVEGDEGETGGEERTLQPRDAVPLPAAPPRERRGGREGG